MDLKDTLTEMITSIVTSEQSLAAWEGREPDITPELIAAGLDARKNDVLDALAQDFMPATMSAG